MCQHAGKSAGCDACWQSAGMHALTSSKHLTASICLEALLDWCASMPDSGHHVLSQRSKHAEFAPPDAMQCLNAHAGPAGMTQQAHPLHLSARCCTRAHAIDGAGQGSRRLGKEPAAMVSLLPMSLVWLGAMWPHPFLLLCISEPCTQAHGTLLHWRPGRSIACSTQVIRKPG